MSQRQSLSISLQSLAVGPGTAYWLNLEQVEQMTDAMTFAEAAEFIDALYDIDPCVPIEGEAGGEAAEEDGEGNPVAPVEEEEFVSLAQQMLERAALCGTLDGSYECKIRVARSHQNEPYKLVIDNGEELQRVTEQGRASQTLIVKGEASASLELPVLGNLTTEWQGPVFDLAGACPGPAVELLGSTLNFGKRVTGTVTAHFDTQYDLVTLKINGNDEGEPQPARVLAFYAGLVAEQQIEPPEVSEEDEETKRLLCDEAGAGLNPTPDSVSCYELVERVWRCRCSGRIVDELTTTEERTVTCPDGLDCPGGASECRKLVRSRSVTVGYTSCPDEEKLEGSVSDPDYYLEQCCEPHPFSLPACKKITEIFYGGKGISAEDKAMYPGAAFIGVGPEDGVCGEVVTTWQVVPRNCCDGVPALVWDSENSPYTITPGGASKKVYVLGGKAPYTWRLTGSLYALVSGNRFQLVETSVPWLTVYADDDACGVLYVRVTDGCSSVIGMIRATVGRWIRVEHLWPDKTAPWVDFSHVNKVTSNASLWAVGENPRYRVEMYLQGVIICYDSFHCSCDCYNYPGASIDLLPNYVRFPDEIQYDGQEPYRRTNCNRCDPTGYKSMSARYLADSKPYVWEWICP